MLRRSDKICIRFAILYTFYRDVDNRNACHIPFDTDDKMRFQFTIFVETKKGCALKLLPML